MNLDSHNLARIERIPASTAIGGEATHFTPWLAEHIEELGLAIDIPLIFGEEGSDIAARLRVGTEVPVGSYRLDVLARTSDNRIVAIENQYGTSDHSHLGQVITYASGVGADVVIWIAEDFTDAHTEAIRWLNSRTDDRCGVFAIRIEFIQIQGSPPAPLFDIVVQPSEWARVQRKVTNTAAENWTLEEFLAAVRNDGDAVSLRWLVEKCEATPNGSVWLGTKGNGLMNVHVNGVHEAPIAVIFSGSGDLLVRGHWNFWTRTKKHPIFEPLARFLGQDYTGPATGVPVSEVDIERLWDLCELYVEELGRISDSDDQADP